MSSPYYNDDFHRSCAEEENSPWHSHQNMPPYDYPYHLYAPSGARHGESSSTAPRFPDTFSPSYNYADSPEMFFDEFEAGSPLSPSSSTSSSSSSCSDAPITPYYQGTGSLPLPAAALLYTKLDTPAGGGGYYDSSSGSGSPDAYCCDAYYEEGWEEDSEMTMHKYKYDDSPECAAALSACQHLEEYDAAATQWACEEAVAHFRRLDASPASAACAPPPQPYTTHPYPYPPPPLSVSAATVTSSSSSSSSAAAASPVRTTQAQAQEYPGPMYPSPPVSCLSPALLQSCPPPPPLKLQLHQPQPRRSIPVVSLAVLASASSSGPHFAESSPALSPLELQLRLRFPAAPVRVDDARMTSHEQSQFYLGPGAGAADSAPIAAAAPAQQQPYPGPGSQGHRCPCPQCTRADAY
ncbi:hypothetical protein C8R46DRAFT_1124623 [Mycena filopes]|nr:hypothetical protein C8R46DRAFT_1124623 [Mycena filopes]